EDDHAVKRGDASATPRDIPPAPTEATPAKHVTPAPVASARKEQPAHDAEPSGHAASTLTKPSPVNASMAPRAKVEASRATSSRVVGARATTTRVTQAAARKRSVHAPATRHPQPSAPLPRAATPKPSKIAPAPADVADDSPRMRPM